MAAGWASSAGNPNTFFSALGTLKTSVPVEVLPCQEIKYIKMGNCNHPRNSTSLLDVEGGNQPEDPQEMARVKK